MTGGGFAEVTNAANHDVTHFLEEEMKTRQDMKTIRWQQYTETRKKHMVMFKQASDHP